MKKLLLLMMGALILVSCGDDETKEKVDAGNNAGRIIIGAVNGLSSEHKVILKSDYQTYNLTRIELLEDLKELTAINQKLDTIIDNVPVFVNALLDGEVGLATGGDESAVISEYETYARLAKELKADVIYYVKVEQEKIADQEEAAKDPSPVIVAENEEEEGEVISIIDLIDTCVDSVDSSKSLAYENFSDTGELILQLKGFTVDNYQEISCIRTETLYENGVQRESFFCNGSAATVSIETSEEGQTDLVIFSQGQSKFIGECK